MLKNTPRRFLTKLGFKTRSKPISHDKLDIFEMLENDDFRFDLFVNTVVGGFSLSKEMAKRSQNILGLKYLTAFVCSKEDIVLFKSLSPDRQNDIEDSLDLIKRGIEWNIIYQELLIQLSICNPKRGKELVWYFIERIHDLERKGAVVPIKAKIEQVYDKI